MKIMSTTAKKTAKTTGLNGAVKTEKTAKKKISYYERQKAINEIAQSINRNITRRNLMKMILE